MTEELMLPIEVIKEKILFIRGRKVMLDRDLATLYGVKTKVLNQAVKRNAKRFPKDFMFRLTNAEKEELVTICDRFNALKHSTSTPQAFTENGVAMLSTVLNSEPAIHVNIQIMRTFTEIRELMNIYKDVYQRLNKLEINQLRYTKEIKQIN